MKGFMSGDHNDQHDAFTRQMSEWLATGAIKVREDVTDGLEHAPAAFIGMLTGANVGKTLVRI